MDASRVPGAVPILRLPGLLLACLAALSLASCATSPPPARPPAGPEAAYAFTDPRHGRPAESWRRRDVKAMEEGLFALGIGDAQAAERAFAEGAARGADPVPFRLGACYASIQAGRLEEAEEGLVEILSTEPAYGPALEALADVTAATAREREALDRYKALLRVWPSQRRATEKVAALKRSIFTARRAEAEASLAAGDLDAARKAGIAMVELEPRAAAGFQVLSRAAEASGRPEDAYAWAIQARNLAPRDPAWTEVVAGLAVKTGRHGEAVAFYDELAAGSPVFAEKADEARLDFRIQNLPDAVRKAALSPRLTRAQLAVLLWGTVPEVRDAPAAGPAEVAVDVVDHRDRSALTRAIALGFLTVNRDSHRVGVDVPLSRAELPAHLRRLAVVAGRGRRVPACLAGDPPPAASLAECGILPESSAKGTTGREALKAIERTARLAREGGPR